MLRSVKSLRGYTIAAKDDTIGKVDDLFFEETSWVTRYLVVDTGSWLTGRRVLISPVSLEQPVTKEKIIPANLTRAEVENSPDIEADKPISRQAEIELHQFYNWAPYWIGIGFSPPVTAPTEEDKKKAVAAAKERVDSVLRSTRKVTGYRIHATDGEIGHAEDFILADQDWVLRYLVVDTKNWLPGRKVLISPNWIEKISWSDSEVYVDLLREQIESSPRFNPSTPINQEYEIRLYDYYGRPKYWI
jgi:hypothetical protein